MNLFWQIAALHPLVNITIFFALGITAGYRLPLPEACRTGLALFLSLLLPTLLIICCKKNCPAKTRLALLIPLSFLLGILHISFSLQIPPEKEALFSLFKKKKEAVIVGLLQEMPTSNGKTASAVINGKWLRLPTEKAFSPVQGEILLRLKGKWPQDILPGDTIIVRADIKRPGSYRTPGAFDYSRYLAEKGIFLTGFIRSPLFLRKIAPGNREKMGIRLKIERYRTIIANALNRQLPPHQAALYKAILLGDRSAIAPSVVEDFKACGILHLLAISGLHLTIVWSVFYFLWYQLLGRSEFLLLHFPVHGISALLTLPFIVIYALLVGLHPPVLRAAIMSVTVVVALIRGQQTSPAPLLCTAALAILLLQPMQLFGSSFQLSFLAVATIFLLLPLLRNIVYAQHDNGEGKTPLIKKIWRWLTAAFLLSGGISLLTAPITALHFNRVSVIGAFANLIVEPLLCLWALPCGIFATPFLLAEKTLPAIDLLPLHLGAEGIHLATSAIAHLAKLPVTFFWIETAEPSFFLGTVLFYGGLFLLVIGREKVVGIGEKESSTFRKRIFIAASGIICLSFPLFFYKPPYENRVVFLDVGQGSATVIEFASGTTILVDGGGTSLSSSSVGERVIAPYLRKRGRKKIDAIVLTHPDADHGNGLAYILENFSPEKLLVRAAGEQHPLQQQLQKVAQDTGCTIYTPQTSETIFHKKGQLFSCFHNFGKPAHPSSHQKNRGLVLFAELDGWRILLPGDIDMEAEKQLLTANIPASEILLAAHHGSKTSNSKEFINALNPELVIVSAGQKKGVFPSQQLTDYLQKKGIPLLSTAKNGTIEVKISKEEITVGSYSKNEDNPLLPHRYREVGKFTRNTRQP